MNGRRLLALGVMLCAATSAPSGARAQAPRPLSFDRYRDEIERVFLAPRGGHGPGASPCVTCHVESGTPLPLQPPETRSDGSVYWTEEQSRRNFEIVSRLVVPGQPERSRLLLKALAVQAGGAPFHVGGKFFQSQDDPEWQRMAAWVRDATPDPAVPTPTPVQLDFSFFQSCVQQIFQSKRPGRMECIHCHNGGAPNFAREIADGRSFWNLEESRANFEILRRYIEPGEPLMSRFLTHPLAPEAGGDPYHGGGRRWMSREDPEWQMLAAWVRGQTPPCRVG
ncbi:MAG: hypothetical protein AB7T31_12260 [Gemmatimonadales bacterium]